MKESLTNCYLKFGSDKVKNVNSDNIDNAFNIILNKITKIETVRKSYN